MDTAAAADEPTEAMEEQIREAAAEVMQQVGEEPTEAMEEQIGEEATEAMEEHIGEETTEAMEEHIGEEAIETEAMELVAGEPEEAGAEEEEEAGASLRPALPVGRVKRIIRVDRDIKKVTTEAALLIAAATELFLGGLASGAHTAASRRGRRTVRAAHVRAAARAHRPTADFLLDCLPADEEVPRASTTAGSGSGSGGSGGGAAKPLPRGTRRIDAFFQKVT